MAAAAASVVQCLARPPGQQRAPSGMGQRRVQARALSFPAQPSPLSTFTTSPAQRLEGPSCPWPATSPAAEGPASSSPVQGVWAALMTGHTVSRSANCASLPNGAVGSSAGLHAPGPASSWPCPRRCLRHPSPRNFRKPQTLVDITTSVAPCRLRRVRSGARACCLQRWSASRGSATALAQLRQASHRATAGWPLGGATRASRPPPSSPIPHLSCKVAQRRAEFFLLCHAIAGPPCVRRLQPCCALHLPARRMCALAASSCSVYFEPNKQHCAPSSHAHVKSLPAHLGVWPMSAAVLSPAPFFSARPPYPLYLSAMQALCRLPWRLPVFLLLDSSEFHMQASTAPAACICLFYHPRPRVIVHFGSAPHPPSFAAQPGASSCPTCQVIYCSLPAIYN